jgi:hypothetical protein
MTSLYTRVADSKRASLRAMSPMERTTAEQPIPAPRQNARATDEIANSLNGLEKQWCALGN